MPQEKKYATPAERQAAYRERQAAARAASRGTNAAAPGVDNRRDDLVTSDVTEHTDSQDEASNSGASSLLHPDPPDDVEDDDLEIADGRYRGFDIVDVDVQHEAHRYLFDRSPAYAFYVRSPQGAIGLVPFPGSTVVWPWEVGWAQDLARVIRVQERRPTDLDWFLRHTKGGS